MALSLFVGDLQLTENLFFTTRPLSIEEFFHDGQFLEAYLHRGSAGQKALGIRMLGVLQHLFHGAPFQNLSIVHHRHVVGNLSHHAEVMGDEHHAHAGFLLKLA